ncbi:MAG TPA: glycerol-3-phosphate 1-O-acyltransferase PlsY [Pyrinomonadaceae bacterium]|nr:glycerol-3-phosphate 1-O-acyltransferase PlsY [Pyrinomonadaceae bacterium]
MRAVLVVMLAYLIGSIPFGYLIVRMSGRGDVRQTGSGGTGATNVSRRAGKAAGVFTLILDACKGAIAVLIATRTGDSSLIAAAAIAVIVGHIFPVWLGFRGGKGVATAVGVFVVLAPLALLCAGIVFLIVFLFTRYVSLGSITAAAIVPFVGWFTGLTLATLTSAVVAAALVIFAHRANIARLINGTEPKFS